VRRIVENGGGNASNLTCNGKINSGASQLTNLTETLLNCEDEIKANCDPSNLPQPNMTEVTACNTAIDIFKTKAGECLAASGSAACTCWSDNTLTAAAKTIKSCDCKDNIQVSLILTQYYSSVTRFKTVCKGIEEMYQHFWKM
jgi:hypothetical protein